MQSINRDLIPARQWVAKMVREESLPKPEFIQKVGWAASYDDLFERHFESIGKIQSLARFALDNGRVLLSGKGGSGKTIALRRLAIQVVEEEIALPILISLFAWNPGYEERWKKLTARNGSRIDFLFENFLSSDSRAQIKSSNLPGLLIVDGLNEIRTSIGAELLEELSDLVAYRSGWRVIVSDRYVRRSFPPALTWKISALLPISPEERARLAANNETGFKSWDSEILASSFFLDLYLREPGTGANASALIRQWFEKHSGIQKAGISIETLAKSAFSLYRNHSRTFKAAALISEIGKVAVNELLASGAVLETHDGMFFDHHLKHDFLASVELVNLKNGSPAKLRKAFSSATFDASSFDVLSLALQEIKNTEDADQFVRSLYDWNLYGTAYAVADARATESCLVSREMVVVLLAVLAEKRWDLFCKTSMKALDALRQFDPKVVAPFLKAKSLSELHKMLRNISSEAVWFQDWVQLFCTTERTYSNQAINILKREDVIGWTSANVLRRLPLAAQELTHLRALVEKNGKASVRWRAAHALGAFPNSQNMTVLLRALAQDNDEWVRYGCMRSLMEIAIRSRRLRSRIISSLASQVARLRKDPQPIRELHASFFVMTEFAPTSDWNPTEWIEAVTPLIETFHDSETTEAGRESWQRTAYELRRMYEKRNKSKSGSSVPS